MHATASPAVGRHAGETLAGGLLGGGVDAGTGVGVVVVLARRSAANNGGHQGKVAGVVQTAGRRKDELICLLARAPCALHAYRGHLWVEAGLTEFMLKACGTPPTTRAGM